MRDYILDVNVIFSMLLGSSKIYDELFSKHTFYVPDFALKEIESYKDMLLAKTKLSSQKLKEFTVILFSRLVVIPNYLISEQSIKQAYQLCKDIDEKDTMYIALSIEFGFPLVTRDKKLYNGLKDNELCTVVMLDKFFAN